MPAIMTHFAFAKMRATNSIDDDALFLGAQGPDVFFFYGYSLKKRPDIQAVRGFGTELHHIDITTAYHYLLKYADSKEGRDKEILSSFIRGLFLHYIMDRNCHPFVFYRTGFSAKPEEGKYYFAAHASYESHIDCLIKERFNIKIAPRKAVSAGKGKVRLISAMMHSLARDVFENEVIKADTYYLSWTDMKFCQIIFHSPLGIKKAMFRAIAPRGAINAMATPRKVKNNDLLDVLNDHKEEWRDCVTNEPRNEAFLELIGKASAEVDTLEKLLKSAYSEADLRAFIHNTDHDGFTVGEDKKHFKSVWDLVPDMRW
ncbi:MAG: zinc dependent phospholipase C family protein [Bacilli bacterium]|jgi:hypothetical protein